MFSARPFAAGAALATIGAILACLVAAGPSQAQSRCEEAAGLAVLSSPMAPWRGAPLHVVFATEKPLTGELSLVAPDGTIAARSRQWEGGPPYVWFTDVASPAPGTWRAKLARDGASGDCSTITREIVVRNDQAPRPQGTPGTVWPLRESWNQASENLYAAWIEKLFDAPLDASPSWTALHEVLRDRSRNILFNHLGLGEDEMGLIIRPDCADLPYFLRAYFAFKVGLPFGYSLCSRGVGKPPSCPTWFSMLNAAAVQKSNLAAAFSDYLRVVADAVHSGSARTLANDDKTDYYPVALTQEELRPGTVYADPYGHVLMLIRRLPQSENAAGILLAVDAQPDGTVARKRFWRGNFLFAQDPALGSPGFKRFRPIIRDKNGVMRRLTNAEIGKDRNYADFSLEQSKLGAEEWYDRMDDVMSPEPLDPMRAMKEAITSLDEQVRARVTSVENGRKYQNSGRGDAEMPDGPAIFETTGAWEDFATPSRDLRLLIAIDVVRNYPDRVSRRPERYAMPPGKSVTEVKSEMEKVLASELSSRKFSYPRTDGSPWTLSLKDVLSRATLLEMGYNLNDCVELRWGAPERSEEASTCRRHAPALQRAKMAKYRAWFHERRRPPRV